MSTIEPEVIEEETAKVTITFKLERFELDWSDFLVEFFKLLRDGLRITIDVESEHIRLMVARDPARVTIDEYVDIIERLAAMLPIF